MGTETDTADTDVGCWTTDINVRDWDDVVTRIVETVTPRIARITAIQPLAEPTR